MIFPSVCMLKIHCICLWCTTGIYYGSSSVFLCVQMRRKITCWDSVYVQKWECAHGNSYLNIYFASVQLNERSSYVWVGLSDKLKQLSTIFCFINLYQCWCGKFIYKSAKNKHEEGTRNGKDAETVVSVTVFDLSLVSYRKSDTNLLWSYWQKDLINSYVRW